MSDLLTVYRHQLIRSVLGTHPAMLAKEHDPVALDNICRRMADAQEALQLLWAKGYGKPDLTLAEIVRALPPKDLHSVAAVDIEPGDYFAEATLAELERRGASKPGLRLAASLFAGCAGCGYRVMCCRCDQPRKKFPGR